MHIKINEIEILLDKLNLLFGNVKAEGELDKVDIELLKKYIQQLQDKLNSFSGNTIDQKKIEPIVIALEKLDTPIKTIIPDIIIPVQDLKEERKNVFENKKPDEINIQGFENKGKIEREVKKHESPPLIIQEKDPVTQTNKDIKLKDKFNTELNTKTIKDKKTLAEKLVSHKAKDLKNVIDLNDKLYFIKRLFKGDKDAYDNVIKNINAMSGFIQVKSYVEKNLAAQYNWNDNPAVERFLEVVQLKYE